MLSRYMLRRQKAETAFAQATDKAAKGGGASLLLVDLDNLQVLNEKGGRDLGDAAIAAATRILRARAKAEGWTFERVGGDELARLKALAERKKTKEAVLLREGLEDVLRKYDRD